MKLPKSCIWKTSNLPEIEETDMQNPNRQNSQHTDLLGDLKELGRKVAGQFLESLENEYAPQRLSLADFLATHSTTLDNTILKTEKTENLNYQAGNAFLRVVGNRHPRFMGTQTNAKPCDGHGNLSERRGCRRIGSTNRDEVCRRKACSTEIMDC